MSFTEAGAGAKDENTGLPKRWNLLEADQCPMCTDDLILFEHLDLWKCGCGFKISEYRKQEITESIGAGDSYFQAFGFSLYHGDNPF